MSVSRRGLTQRLTGLGILNRNLSALGRETLIRTHRTWRGDLIGAWPGAPPAGYTALLKWMRSFGRLERVGVEGTGVYDAGLARLLH
ncbi:hypothetical protein GCM10010182_71260 [Actinomadura cremea]|nr:hypothetical protein GCM10010182_71260 [Actinomadura cremea]